MQFESLSFRLHGFGSIFVQFESLSFKLHTSGREQSRFSADVITK